MKHSPHFMTFMAVCLIVGLICAGIVERHKPVHMHERTELVVYANEDSLFIYEGNVAIDSFPTPVNIHEHWHN